MDLFQAIVLGIVQGLGEFLPISSSAHLVLVPWLAGWPYAGLTFDVALHVGTLFAVIAFFWRDWLLLIGDGLRVKKTIEGRLFWYIAFGTIPGALVGYLLEDQAETIFRNPLLIGIMLIIMGIILHLVDTRALAIKKLEEVGLKEGLMIGISQALAIVPGVSRSGITMTAGRLMGLTRETSARFSFLLSTPIVAGAGLKKLTDVSPGDINTAFLVGVAVSAVVGFLSIKFLLNYLARRSYSIFVWYRFLLGAFVITVYLIR
ncbi:undecaprenyl-diphosphatase UppP [Desulfoscipio gibsoniae]|uniref:Undecaprenyl-diphosphatase n=1 Tax=Desulfoscipio gibsoniae DSM 7213 TaxID=767817 RepID=R4KLA9_9FIRM|nr:undecaprenyl-diphosphatase UppP [Desulfoscipio gibsoniae]AGL01320.1 undecaprenyl-diphosphatase UppP [Desulfoscipio gibsoniae DSM 7213]